jgi:hypothetical protein
MGDESPRRDPVPARISIFVFVIVYASYLMTMSPGISWAHHSEDSGDLITAAYTLGIPHPTGYPLFCLLGWLWSHLLAVGNVAWRMNAFSGLWSALACAAASRAMYRSFVLFGENTEQVPRHLRVIASISTGTLLGWSSYVWQQSVITEVYSLNLFFASMVTWILIELMSGAMEFEKAGANNPGWEIRRRNLVVALGLLEGFAMTNHLTSIMFLPAILLVLFIGRTGITVKDFALGMAGNILPLLLYFYLPLRSSMNPFLDWGNPENWNSFLWVVTGKQFSRLMFSMMPYQMLHQIMRYDSLGEQLGIFGTIAAGVGVCRLMLAKSARSFSLLVLTLVLTASGLFYLVSYYIWDPEGYILPLILAGAMWAGWSAVIVTNIPSGAKKFVQFVLSALLIISPMLTLTSHYNATDLSGTREAMKYGEESFQIFEPDSLVLEIRYERAFTLWYYREIELKGARDDVAVVFVEHTIYDWGLELQRRNYPWIKFPDTPMTGEYKDAKSAAWIIRNNINDRPVYVGAEVKELAEEGYTFEAEGLLYRVYPPE